jgi:hypothetical protein
VGITIDGKRDCFTEDGIGEMLQLIKSEINGNPPLAQYHGTWFGDNGAMNDRQRLSEINRHDTILALQRGRSDIEYAKEVYSNIQQSPYVILFYRTDPKSINLEKN